MVDGRTVTTASRQSNILVNSARLTAKFRRGDPVAVDFLVMLVLSNVIHDFDVTRVPIVDKPDAIR